jgi:hypothetical protein
MGKKAISVTVRPEYLLWLRGQTQAALRRSVSETLDELLAEARTGTRGRSGVVKSVVGSIRISAADPGLMRADAAIRRLFFPSPSTPRARGLPASSPRTRRA